MTVNELTVNEIKAVGGDILVTLADMKCTEVVELSDFTGSTTQIFDYVKRTNHKTYIICTEKGVVDRLERDYKDKNFVLVNEKIVCHNMKQNSLEDIYNALLNEEFEVNVDEKIRNLALKSINAMISIKSGKETAVK